jgi:hypothetical protein
METLLPEFARAWYRQRSQGDIAVAAIERDELRRLDDATALKHSEALLAAVPRDAMAERRATSGIVEQQRLFARWRR